jgi:hypothetical protein
VLGADSLENVAVHSALNATQGVPAARVSVRLLLTKCPASPTLPGFRQVLCGKSLGRNSGTNGRELENPGTKGCAAGRFARRHRQADPCGCRDYSRQINLLNNRLRLAVGIGLCARKQEGTGQLCRIRTVDCVVYVQKPIRRSRSTLTTTRMEDLWMGIALGGK